MAYTLNTPVSTRVNAGQISIAVTITDSDTSPTLVVERMDNAGTVVEIGRLLFAVVGTNAFTDTAVAANNKYAYRGKIYSNGGVVLRATSAWSGYVHTQPTQPGTPTVSRNGTNVALTWGDGNAVGAGSTITHAKNSGAWDADTVYAGTLGGTVNLTGVTTADTHQYKVRHYGDGKSTGGSGDRFYTDYVLGPLMAAVLAPLAPSVSVPSLANRTQALTVGVQHNHAGDYHVQTAGNLRYRLIGAGAWTTVAIGTSSAYTFAANTLPAGSYEFQAQTQGYAANGYGPWSASVVAVLTTPPVATITTPADGSTFTGARITTTWGYYDAEGSAQAGWQLSITDTGTGLVAYSTQGTGAATSYLAPCTLADGHSYSVSVSVQDGAGAWSDPAVATFTVSYVPTPAPTFTTVWDPDTGAATLTITNPAPGGGQVAAVSNNVYRDGVLIAELVPVSSVWVDRIPPTNTTVTYRVEAVSAGYTTASTSHTLDTPSPSWAFLNGGDGYSILGRMRDGVAITSVPDRTKALVTFEGRDLPLEFAGQGRTRALRIAGDVNTYSDDDDTDPLGPRGTWQPFEQLAEALAPLCFRDMLGRRWLCSVDAMTIGVSAQDGRTTSVSYVVTQVGDNE